MISKSDKAKAEMDRASSRNTLSYTDVSFIKRREF